MPEFIEGDLWEEELGRADLLLVTTNACLRQDNALVMGRGAAQELRDRFPGIDKEAGKQLLELGPEFWMRDGQPPPRRPYGILPLQHSFKGERTETFLGLFQVKFHWKDAAEPGLIQDSCHQLAAWVKRRRNGPPVRVAVNFPGIGNGRLLEATVRPILEAMLPAEVHVYRLPPDRSR